jgi:hypothetical protein
LTDISQTDQGFNLVKGAGKYLYGLSLLIAFGGGLFILFVHVSFLAWAASGLLYFSELTFCALSALGVLGGLIFFWSTKPFISRMTMFSCAVLAILGFLVIASTINRDQAKTNVPQVSFGLVLPVLLTFIGAATSYFKLEQLTASSR